MLEFETTAKRRRRCLDLAHDVHWIFTILHLQETSMLSYRRDRPAGWVSYGQKWKTGTGRQYLRTIWIYIQLLRRIWSAKQSKSAKKKRKIRAITPFKVIQGHRGWHQSKVRICDLTDILSRTISEISHLIVQILDTLRFWATLWGGGLRDNVRCSSSAHWKVRSGLPIGDNWTFFARCYGWRATSENRSKIGDFAPTRSVWPKFQVEEDVPHQSFLHGI